MGLTLLLDKDQYVDGKVTVYRGDRWRLEATVVDRVGGVDNPVDLTNASCSGYFPDGNGGIKAIAAQLVSAVDGRVVCTVVEADSALIGLATEGIPFWMAFTGQATPAGLQDLQTPASDLFIQDPKTF